MKLPRQARRAEGAELPALLHRPGDVATRHRDGPGRPLLGRPRADRLGLRPRARARRADRSARPLSDRRRHRCRPAPPPGGDAGLRQRPLRDAGPARPLLITGHAELWELLVLQFLGGTATAFFLPAVTGL